MHTCAFSSLREEGNQPKVLGDTIPSEPGSGSSKNMAVHHRDFRRLWLNRLSTSGENTELKLTGPDILAQP